MKIKIHYVNPPKSHLKKYWSFLLIFLVVIVLINLLWINPNSEENKGVFLFASVFTFFIFLFSIYIYEGYRFEKYLAENHPGKWAKLNKGGSFLEEIFSREYFNKKTREFIASSGNLNDKNIDKLKTQQFMLNIFYVTAFISIFLVLIIIYKYW